LTSVTAEASQAHQRWRGITEKCCRAAWCLHCTAVVRQCKDTYL